MLVFVEFYLLYALKDKFKQEMFHSTPVSSKTKRRRDEEGSSEGNVMSVVVVRDTKGIFFS